MLRGYHRVSGLYQEGYWIHIRIVELALMLRGHHKGIGSVSGGVLDSYQDCRACPDHWQSGTRSYIRAVYTVSHIYSTRPQQFICIIHMEYVALGLGQIKSLYKQWVVAVRASLFNDTSLEVAKSRACIGSLSEVTWMGLEMEQDM
jgi:hypothetical protein